ncbi:beta-glucosidase [Corticicoccus populi]|uniref:Beta-glucosidase n=1 Tax=Corticicoccus populi TaxID=1812821 RepID=A0ABW5WWJ0_9STAP
MEDNNTIIEKLSLEDKIKIVTGKEFWYTHPLEKFGLKSILLTDGPSGIRKQNEGADALGLTDSVETIGFPSLALIASSFDKTLANQYGRLLGDIANSEGVNVLLGPGINIKRSPLGGRNFEYMSEDPLVAGALASEYVKGVQSKGVGTSVKHFAANNRENQRFTSSSNVEDRALREIYLSAFEKVVKSAQPATVMSSYNLLNGTAVSENKWLLTDVLRNEWGFKGTVVSDWSAVKNRVPSLKAGLNLEMPGKDEYTTAEIKKAIADGDLEEGVLDQSVDRVLSLIKNYQNEQDTGSYDKDEYHEFAREIAGKSMILLKNENETLPIKPEESIGVIGALAQNPRHQGGGSSKVNPYKVTTPLHALRQGMNCNYAEGYKIDEINTDESLFSEAVKTAENNAHVVLFLGYPENYETEGLDKENLNLPENQRALLEAVAEVNRNVTVVLQNGGIVLAPWADKVSAIVETYLPGEAGGEALADILTGRVNPSGRLAETVPKRIEDVPSYLSFNQSKQEENYYEGIYVGYRYYDTKKIPVQYPFGHGLSYTTFEYNHLNIEQKEDVFEISCDVKNTGSYDGDEVVQLYVGNKTSDIDMPSKELRAFERVSLKQGETQTVTVKIPFDSLRWYNSRTQKWQIDDGEYEMYVGRSIEDIRLTQEFKLERNLGTELEWIHQDTYVSEIVENQDMFEEALQKHGIDQLIKATNDDEGLAALFENMPIRSLIMVGLKTENLNRFIEDANEIIKNQK